MRGGEGECCVGLRGVAWSCAGLNNASFNTLILPQSHRAHRGSMTVRSTCNFQPATSNGSCSHSTLNNRLSTEHAKDQPPFYQTTGKGEGSGELEMQGG